MTGKLGIGLIGAMLVLLTAQGCIFGGGDGSGGSAARPGSIVTATLPATMTEPILLGQSQVTGGGGAAGGGSSGQTYVIKSGDTLGGIATSFGVAPDQQAAWIAEVARLNNISDPRLLAVGVELTLPRLPNVTATPRVTGTPPAGTTGTPGTSPTAAATSLTSTPTRTATITSGGSGRTYTVVSGDYPLLIAEKLKVPDAQRINWANELISLNGFNPSSMTVGAVLQLPASTP